MFDIVEFLGDCLVSGGLNLTGSRLLSLSKNSDVCLAGVSGIKRSGVRLKRYFLLYCSETESLELVDRVSKASANSSDCSEVISIG